MLLITLLPMWQSIAEPPPIGKWESIAELSDEFNGAVLDTTKWYDHCPWGEGRKPGWISPANVSVGSGLLTLTARKEEGLPGEPEGYNTWTVARVQSEKLVLYGYFEIRAKTMPSLISSAFWFVHHEPTLDTEIDVFEMNGIWNNGGRDHMNVWKILPEPRFNIEAIYYAPYDFSADYHIFGLLWNATTIQYYVDGTLRNTVDNTYWHQPLYMCFDDETMPDWFGLPTVETFPKTFNIDYVRSWKIIKDTIISVQTENDRIPDTFVVNQNFPNPFNQTTIISYGLPQSSQVTLTVYNVKGSKIIELVNENQNAGFHSVNWDGMDSSGKKISTGQYIYKIQAGYYSYVKKMMLIK